MESNKNPLKVYMPWLLGLCSLMSLIAISDLPYGYYTLLRLVIFFTGILYLLFFRNYQLPFIDILVFLAILIWNPIFPVYLRKETWTGLNITIVAASILLIFQINK
jgi:membrane protein implicated in regulation of membrane protease activity